MNLFRASLFVLMICASLNGKTQHLNLDMEEVDIYAMPIQWRLGHPPSDPIVYRLLGDSTVKHNGHYSLKIFSNSARAKFGTCFLQILLPAGGKKVTLKGYVRTENIQSGWGGLFLALVRDSVTLAFDNMQDKGLKGDNDWKEFTISLAVPAGATMINFGGLLVGPGIVWVDDLRLLVDDKEITNTAILQPEMKDPHSGKMIKF